MKKSFIQAVYFSAWSVPKNKAPSFDGALFLYNKIELHGQRVANAVEGIVDLLTKGGHDSNYDDGNERENDRVLNESLTFFFRSE